MKHKLVFIPALAIISLFIMVCTHSYQTTKPNVQAEDKIVTYEYIKDGFFTKKEKGYFTVNINGNNVSLKAIIEAKDSYGNRYIGFTDGYTTNGEMNLFVYIYKIQDGKIVLQQPETKIERIIVKQIISDYSNTNTI